MTEEDGVCSQRHSVTSGHSYFGFLGWERSKAQGALSRSHGLRSEAHGQPRSGIPTGEGRWQAEMLESRGGFPGPEKW